MTSPQAFEGLKLEKRPVWRISANLAVSDHNVPTTDRSHGIEKGPRTLDLDLLLYVDAIMETPELTLPHPEMHRRRFVLEPLAAIAPEMIHPVLHRTVRQILQELDAAAYTA